MTLWVDALTTYHIGQAAIYLYDHIVVPPIEFSWLLNEICTTKRAMSGTP